MGIRVCEFHDAVKGNCGISCFDLRNGDITDAVKCVKEVLKVERFFFWIGAEECVLKSKDIIKECFENVLDNKCIINAVPDITSKLPQDKILENNKE